MSRLAVTFAGLALALVLAPAAGAAQRYATPTGSATSPACAASDPCRIDRAIHGAAAGDEVIVRPGTYRIDIPLRPGVRIDLHGNRDHAWPRLIGGTDLNESVLTFRAGSVGHLSLESNAAGEEALTLEGGIADGLRLLSPSAGGSIWATASRTVLRNTVVRVSGQGLTLAGSEGDDPAIELRNVTVAAAGGPGIECDVEDGQATLVNVLVRGAGADIDASDSDGACSAAYSNFRPAVSPGVQAGAGNQSAEPIFADAELRPAAGSPTIDAGAFDVFASSPDPDGRPRSLGAAPDIGAYEYPGPGGGTASEDPAGESSGQMPEELRGVPVPQQGKSMVVAAKRGTIRIRRPGSSRFVVLDEPARIPLASVVDARRGRVLLVSAITADGVVQAGLFWGSRFKTRQRRSGSGMTTLVLRGGDFSSCRSAPTATTSRKRKRKAKRSLWARDDDGKFRTHGNDSVATARGTAWVTHDRCDGTLTRVTRGAVIVRDLARGRRVRLDAGESYLARGRR
jgi:hypothetical protein